MMVWVGRTSVGMSVAFLMVAAQAQAGRVSRAKSGTAVCPDKAVRVLVIGGELQSNSWCDVEAKVTTAADKKSAAHEAKKAEREEYARKQDEERSRKKDEEKRREDEEKLRAEKAKREAERKKHDCRGVGSGAGCTEANPGKGKAVKQPPKK